MQGKTPKIWVLVDDRIGNTSQVMGVAEALDLPFEIKNIEYTCFGRLPSFIKNGSTVGLAEGTKRALVAPWPDVVISVARRMESATLYIKRNSPSTKIVHIQNPESPLEKFDLVAAPAHDFKKGTVVPKNVLLTVGAPNRVNSKKLEEGRARWEAEFADLPHPRIAVLLGGDTKRKKFTLEHAAEIAEKTNKLLEDAGGGSLLVTTSRRTPVEVIDFLKEKFKEPKYFYDYRDGGDNPYNGLLACADAIVATGDSVSMCSEACTSGKPAYLYYPESLVSKKHSFCQENLVAKGYARALGDKWGEWKYTPLADAKTVAEYIRSVIIYSHSTE